MNLLDDHNEQVLQEKEETHRDEDDEAVEHLVRAFRTINALHSSSKMQEELIEFRNQRYPRSRKRRKKQRCRRRSTTWEFIGY